MQKKDTWLLPDGIEEVLPDQAPKLELLRRKILDTFSTWGYSLVIPPMVDFLDSLLTGSGHDLDLQTFKLTDQISGKLLGVRADMTPQVARIAGHHMPEGSPARLCYAGTVLHTLGDNLDKSRSPMQIGAELYGHAGLDSDYEIIQLMLEMLSIAGIDKVHLDLGHVGIFRTLAEQAGLNEQQESELFDVLQRKAVPELGDIVDGFGLQDEFRKIFLALPGLCGNSEVLLNAEKLFAGLDGSIFSALQDLQAIASRLKTQFPDTPVHFDLSELRGYHYHTGIVFAAFTPEVGKEIARGGRYDNIGSFFAKPRAATGFSADLKTLVNLSPGAEQNTLKQVVLAPCINEDALHQRVKELRADGVTVIMRLPEQSESAADIGCTAILEKQDQNWVIKPIK